MIMMIIIEIVIIVIIIIIIIIIIFTALKLSIPSLCGYRYVCMSLIHQLFNANRSSQWHAHISALLRSAKEVTDDVR